MKFAGKRTLYLDVLLVLHYNMNPMQLQCNVYWLSKYMYTIKKNRL